MGNFVLSVGISGTEFAHLLRGCINELIIAEAEDEPLFGRNNDSRCICNDKKRESIGRSH